MWKILLHIAEHRYKYARQAALEIALQQAGIQGHKHATQIARYGIAVRNHRLACRHVLLIGAALIGLHVNPQVLLPEAALTIMIVIPHIKGLRLRKHAIISKPIIKRQTSRILENQQTAIHRESRQRIPMARIIIQSKIFLK